MQPTASFEWDDIRELANQRKHGVSFSEAQHAFADPRRIILRDVLDSADEDRFVCVGRVGRGTVMV
jgi:uncharacterized protein